MDLPTSDIVYPPEAEEIIATIDVGGNTPLPICSGCYDEDEEPPFSEVQRRAKDEVITKETAAATGQECQEGS